MDVDLPAGGDSCRRRTDSGAAAESTMDIVPLEMYDSARAKIAANLRWLFAKAYGIDSIPEDLRDPFYTDQYEQEHIKPPVIHLMLSGELYCRVYALILKTEQAASLQSHLSVIQALSRKGIYVVESDGTPVTDDDLTTMPIKMSAHMHMIDHLMMAYTVEMISIEKVVDSVKRFSTFSSSQELPFDLEDAMIFWINKVNTKMREITERELKVKPHPLESPSHQKVRYRREHASGRQLPFFPLLEDLMRDVCDGAALLTVVHTYCPDHIKLEDICLKEVPSIADSLYNIQLLREFANEYLNNSFYLTTEDMLYSPLVLKQNMMVFIAELFWWFETVKPEFVKPRDLQEFKDARAITQPKSARPSVPISNATKRSFLASPCAAESQSSPEVCNRYFLHPEDSEPLKAGPTFSPSHPLLPLRQRHQKQHGEEGAGLRNRSNSLTGMDGQPRGSSMMAWPDKRQRPLSTLSPYVFRSATDNDADVASGDSVSLARSISKDSLASNVVNVTPKHQSSAQQAAAAHRLNGHSLPSVVNLEDEEETLAVAARRMDGMPVAAAAPPCHSQPAEGAFYLEPLLPAVLKTAKEKSVCVNKEEESGEGPRPSARGPQHRDLSAADRRKAPRGLSKTFLPSGEEELRPAEAPRDQDPPSRDPAGAFYLHAGSKEPKSSQSLDSELEDLDEGEEDLDLEAVTTKEPHWVRKTLIGNGEEVQEGEEEDEEESAKLQEDMNVKEHEDKDRNGSGRSSPCLSAHSQASSAASGGVRMTSFAERRAQQQRFGSSHDLRSSASSSQRTTPDGSESSGPPAASPWRLKRDQSPSSPQGGGPRAGDGTTYVLASEMVQLRMQLEEKRRAIEHQKKKMEVLAARQRQKLGKAAFLHIVKKSSGGGRSEGRSDTLPNPLKADVPKDDLGSERAPASRDDSFLGVLKASEEAGGTPDNRGGSGGGDSFSLEEEDLNECSRSIELLNDAIGSLQQQMMQLSAQQESLMRQNLQSPPVGAAPPPGGGGPESYRCVESLTHGAGGPARKPPKLSSGRRSKARPAELKLREHERHGARSPAPTLSGPDNTRSPAGGRSPRAQTPRDQARSASFRLHDEANARLPTRVDLAATVAPEAASDDTSPARRSVVAAAEEVQRSKSQLIEVDLSELKAPEDEEAGEEPPAEGDGEPKPLIGFFFKDEQKAEDELAKKRAAFLLKQQKKAEEARLRKQQLEAESELKRDEVRRKAEEERLRKEEEKTRRELIKQEYLRRKQQEMFEEQGLVKPKTPKPKQKHRPKSVFREESSAENHSKGSSTPDNLSDAQSGSNLSLASAATTEADSVHSGGAGSQRCDSVESFPGSRNASRTVERDWDNGSTASSITSMAEYTGPKLFKEPSAKSNKPIIHNAISHCCLAGKVNEPQKNQILEELEKCESNHLIILFRDGGCQFRALYSYFPDTEEILKLTGTGPKSVSKKMIDKLYKYNSDRKQFTVIPAKTVSVSVDALTIHNHLWQAKRGGATAPKKNGK